MEAGEFTPDTEPSEQGIDSEAPAWLQRNAQDFANTLARKHSEGERPYGTGNGNGQPADESGYHGTRDDWEDESDPGEEDGEDGSPFPSPQETFERLLAEGAYDPFLSEDEEPDYNVDSDDYWANGKPHPDALHALAADLDLDPDEDPETVERAFELLFPDDGNGVDPAINAIRATLANEVEDEKEAFYARNTRILDELQVGRKMEEIERLKRDYPELADPRFATADILEQAALVADSYGMGDRSDPRAIEIVLQRQRLATYQAHMADPIHGPQFIGGKRIVYGRPPEGVAMEGGGGDPGMGESDADPLVQLGMKYGGGRGNKNRIAWPGGSK